jgi:hypothetical protein
MSNETTKIDANQIHTVAGVTYDANTDIMNLTLNPVDKRLRVDASISDVGDGATSAKQDDIITALGDGSTAVKLIDESGVAYGVKHVQNKPSVSSMPYTYDISEGNVSGHTP